MASELAKQDLLVERGWFSAAELDASRGLWTAEKIDVIRRYIQYPTGCWTPKELWMIERLQSALNFIDASLKVMEIR